jgi:3-phenylpropionate/trans-cinnamate dioxygenase ferredoxin reductase subunit
VIEADLILVGIGAIPNTELAESAGVECDNGILVDEQCRTSVANIYAAGDCTNHPNHYLNRRLRLESAPNATDQAKVAAVNMLGEDKCYRSVPWFWSDQFSSKLQAVGFSADGTSSVCRGRQEEHEFATFYLHDNRLVAVEAINFPRAFMVGKRLYGLQVDVEKLADSSVDLKSLLV